MRKYLDKSRLRYVLKKMKEKLDQKADKAELAVQSNPNLLDNWYFRKVVNQTGQTQYVKNSIAYTIDRWRLARGTLSVEDDGVSFYWDGQNGSSVVLQQPAPIRSFIENKSLTMSILTEKGLISKNVKFGGTSEVEDDIWFMVVGDPNANDVEYINILTNSLEPIKIYAAKLELGDHQTLAHKDAEGNWVLNDPPPNYGTELAKCQRYYQIFATENKRPVEAEDFRPVMRIKPTPRQISIGDKTYYTADANL